MNPKAFIIKRFSSYRFDVQIDVNAILGIRIHWGILAFGPCMDFVRRREMSKLRRFGHLSRWHFMMYILIQRKYK